MKNTTNESDKIAFKPIGLIKSPFETPGGMPIQPKNAKGIEGKIEIFPEYIDCLDGLEGFSHIHLIYFLHLVKKEKHRVVPFLSEHETGVFSTRAPSRPNPIGLSVVETDRIEKNIIYIRNVDIVNNTPLLDIKPYVAGFDDFSPTRQGWLERNIEKLPKTRSDRRFDDSNQ
jgi:tRNA-Thr(GGU) m(6)t(6)A37 methyltransferase TsaA